MAAIQKMRGLKNLKIWENWNTGVLTDSHLQMNYINLNSLSISPKDPMNMKAHRCHLMFYTL